MFSCDTDGAELKTFLNNKVEAPITWKNPTLVSAGFPPLDNERANSSESLVSTNISTKENIFGLEISCPNIISIILSKTFEIEES